MRKLKVGKSKIAGKGLFTTAEFAQGEMIGLAHENDQPTTFIGKYHNHSDEPNAESVKLGDKRYLMAKRPLKKGEEITTNYRLQPELEQPEDFKKEKGGQMTPQKDGYRTYSPFKQLPYIDVESDTIDSDNIVYDLNLQADNGLSKFIEKNTGLHTIPGAKVIREIPVKKQGGLVKMPKPSKKGLASKKFSKSIEATNRLFTENYLFSKSKSRKNKVFDPNAKYYQDGGITTPEDYDQFKTFAETLPSNLQDPNFEYGNPDQYDLYGMWETVGKPASFTDVQDSEYFPLDEDGTYHGFTVGSDGTLLKPMSHSTTWKEVMNSQLSTDPFFQQNTLIRNEQGRLQYIPKAEYGMPMGGGMSQNYMGRRKFIHQDGGITSQEEYAIGGVAFPMDLDPKTMAKYKEALKRQENSLKAGYRKAEDKWYPHKSPEGGKDTIAYGHKLVGPDANKYYKGITTAQANALLESDILKHQTIAENMVDQKYGKGTFDKLPQDSQMLLVDYAYNAVLDEFPTFMGAVVRGDKDTMLKEYERYGGNGLLKERNAWTKDVILNADVNTPSTLPNKTSQATSTNSNRDKWGRTPDTIWYGFNPDTKQYEQQGLDWPQYGDPGPGVGGPGAGTYVSPGERLREYEKNNLKKQQVGGDVISQQGWDYTKEGDKYLTRKTGTQDWIEAQGKPLQAIKQSIYQEAPAVTPVVNQPTTTTVQPVSGNQEVLEIQKKLKDAGYDLGTYGPNKDGVDGVMGNRTKLAYDAYKANIPPNQVKVPKKTTKPTINYTVNRDLPDGYLPVIQPGQEACVEGKGCSFNVSVKMGDLLGNIADGPLWANDAWFNKSDILNKGGDLIYDSNSKIYNQMGKVPKEVYSKLQVGDYVQLNRTDTASSGKFAAQTKDGLQNEQIEHLGFVVGKDKDGTPLIWHGSETGKAFIKRIDEPITLDDHDKNIFTYKVSSIVRSPNLKDVDFSGLQNSPYYTPVDPNKKLVPKQGATEAQVQAAKSFNNSIGQFKNLGYSQDDANYVGQILIGGIMTRESKGAEDWKVAPKQAAAYLIKDVAGMDAFDVNVPGIGKVRVPGKEFEGDQASVGVYQIKPDYNFRTKDGGLNPLGKKLQRLGVKVEDITSDNIQAQTIAGTLILLDNYKKLKENPDFDVKTNLYKGKIPASYILAKSWNAGSGWESREKYEKFLNDLDINYSNKALNEAADFIEVTGGKSINSELSTIEQQQKQILEKKQQENAKKQFAARQEEAAVRADTVRKFPTIAESTAVNTNYSQKGPKTFDASTYIQQGPAKTLYTYPGRPGAMYKKDSKGNWYINLGNKTGNQFVKIQDPDGSRTALLNKGAVPSVPKGNLPSVPRTFKNGGIYMELTDSEIEEFRRGGYIIEDLD